MKVYNDDEGELVDVDLDDGGDDAAVVSTRNDALSKSLQVGHIEVLLQYKQINHNAVKTKRKSPACQTYQLSPFYCGHKSIPSKER